LIIDNRIIEAPDGTDLRDCIIEGIGEEVSPDLRDKVTGVLTVLAGNDEIVAIPNPDYPRGGKNPMLSLKGVRWANAPADPDQPSDPSDEKEAEVTTPQPASDVPVPIEPEDSTPEPGSTPDTPGEEAAKPNPTENMSGNELLNHLILALRVAAAGSDQHLVNGGAAPLLRAEAPHLSVNAVTKIVGQLSHDGYIHVLKKGGKNTLIKVDMEKADYGEATADQPTRDQKGADPIQDPQPPAPADSSDEQPAPPTPATAEDLDEGLSDPEPEAATSAGHFVSDEQMAMMIGVADRLKQERDDALNDVTELKAQVGTLTSRLKERTDELEDVDRVLKSQTNNVRELETVNGRLKADNNRLKIHNQRLQTELSKKPDEVTSVVSYFKGLLDKPTDTET
jgi:hypothetical protein